MLPHGSSLAPLREGTKPCPFGRIFTKRCAAISPIYVKPGRALLRSVRACQAHGEEAAADVTVRVRCPVITVQVESTIVLVLVVVSTNVQHNTTGVVVAVIAVRTGNRKKTPDYW